MKYIFTRCVQIVEADLVLVGEPCFGIEVEIRFRLIRQLVMVILEKGCHSALASM
jgi:hypothetical protein